MYGEENLFFKSALVVSDKMKATMATCTQHTDPAVAPWESERECFLQQRLGGTSSQRQDGPSAGRAGRRDGGERLPCVVSRRSWNHLLLCS